MSTATAATAPRHMPLRDPRGVYSRQGGTTMSEPQQLFRASLAQYAGWKPGLRSFMEYRDLGVERATHGKFRAHVIRIKKDAAGNHALHTTGLHKHECDFQMFYVLRGWIRFVYRDHGEHTRSEEHTSELQSQFHLVCRLLLEKKKKKKKKKIYI